MFKYFLLTCLVAFITYNATSRSYEHYTEYLEKMVSSGEVSGSLSEKKRELYITNNKYLKATPEELLTKWNKMFIYSKYKLGGNRRLNLYDCSLAVLDYLRIQWGANVGYEDVRSMTYRARKTAVIRGSIYQVKPGDIITFKYSKSWHCGLVIKKLPHRNRIQYVDVNKRVNGTDFPNCIFKQAYMIFEPSYPFWCGDLATKY